MSHPAVAHLVVQWMKQTIMTLRLGQQQRSRSVRDKLETEEEPNQGELKADIHR